MSFDIGYKVENAILHICTAFVVLGLFYMSNSFHSLWGLLMYWTVSSEKSKKTKE